MTRSLVRSLVLLAAAAWLVSAGPSRADSHPAWIVEFEGMGLEREHVNDRPISRACNANAANPDCGSNQGNRNTVLSADDVMEDDLEGAGRLLVGRRFGRDGVEAVFNFFGHEHNKSAYRPDERLYPTFDDRSIGGGNSSFLAERNGDFTNARRHILEFESRFWDGGLNWVRDYSELLPVERPNTHLRFRVGVRVARFEETLQLTSYDGVVARPRDAVLGGGNAARLEIETDNWLAGGQVGVEGQLGLGSYLSIGTSVLAGGYANVARVIRTYDEDGKGDGRPVHTRDNRKETDPAALVETSAHLNVHPAEGVILGLGYRMYYLHGIAVASEVYPQSAHNSEWFGNAYRNDGNTIFHGPSVKLTFEF